MGRGILYPLSFILYPLFFILYPYEQIAKLCPNLTLYGYISLLPFLPILIKDRSIRKCRGIATFF